MSWVKVKIQDQSGTHACVIPWSDPLSQTKGILASEKPVQTCHPKSKRCTTDEMPSNCYALHAIDLEQYPNPFRSECGAKSAEPGRGHPESLSAGDPTVRFPGVGIAMVLKLTLDCGRRSAVTNVFRRVAV